MEVSGERSSWVTWAMNSRSMRSNSRCLALSERAETMPTGLPASFWMTTVEARSVRRVSSVALSSASFSGGRSVGMVRSLAIATRCSSLAPWATGLPAISERREPKTFSASGFIVKTLPCSSTTTTPSAMPSSTPCVRVASPSKVCFWRLSSVVASLTRFSMSSRRRRITASRTRAWSVGSLTATLTNSAMVASIGASEAAAWTRASTPTSSGSGASSDFSTLL